MKPVRSLLWPVLACMFAALIVVGSYIAVPMPGTMVPLVLQNFFVVLAALILGPIWGPVAVIIYLTLGLLGLPVFSRGGSGLAHFVGPTGGYLVGYLVGAVVMGLVANAGDGTTVKGRIVRNAIAAVLGVAIISGFGLVWYKLAADLSWAKAIVAGALIFLPGDVVKMLVAVPLAARVRNWLDDTLGAGGVRD